MRTLQFNNTAGLILDASNSLIVLTDLEALVNKIEQRMKFFSEEWFLNTTTGIPYFQQIFEKPVDPSLIISLINDDIVQEPDVISVSESSMDFDRQNRTFQYSATVNTIYGSSTVESGVTI